MTTMVAAAWLAGAATCASVLASASAFAADFAAPHGYGMPMPPRVATRMLIDGPMAEAPSVIVRRPVRMPSAVLPVVLLPAAAPQVPTRIIEQRIVQQPGVTTKTTRIYDNMAAPVAGPAYGLRPPREIFYPASPYGRSILTTSAPVYPAANGYYGQPLQGFHGEEDLE